MGNAHTHAPRSRAATRTSERRLSAPDDGIQPTHSHLMLVSSSMGTTPQSTTPPRIQINGADSIEEFDQSPERPASTQPAPTASLRRMQFLSNSSSASNTARSLDDSRLSEVLQMKPLSRAKSHSPLKQLRTYSYRSLSSEENALDKVSCELIRSSWAECQKRATEAGHDFGYFVFQRIFQKMPELRRLFGLNEGDDLSDLGDDHPALRHTRIFTNILHLASKNVDELEPQVAPAIFKYGERHYTPKVTEYMTEENVRMVCAQVVCTVCDLLGEEAQPQCVEAWIEMMRYLGRKLLDGHEYAKLMSKHRISINRNDHHLFLML